MSTTDEALWPSPVPSGYRPWLDGLRAIAVSLVLVQHAVGRLPFDLGSTGVGLFFGLSGYLITSLLLDERRRDGAVALGRFYLRRAARLLPALVAVLVVCDVVFLLQGDNGPVRGTLFALTYTANYALVADGGAVPAYGPTWSLAVEEHFYVLWPLLLLALTTRHGLRGALRVTLAICVAAVVWRALLLALGAPMELTFIGSIERADALLWGCAAAIAVRLGWRPAAWVLWAGVAAAVVVAVTFTEETAAAAVVGSAVLALAAAAIVVALDCTAPAWVRGTLSAGPVVRIGVLSYGIYLWHGPLMRIVAEPGDAGRLWRIATVPLVVGVAAVSHRWLETPVRAWARRRPVRADPVVLAAPAGAGAPEVR